MATYQTHHNLMETRLKNHEQQGKMVPFREIGLKFVEKYALALRDVARVRA